MAGEEDRVVAIIPARLESTRFSRKVLAAETGRPLIRHVVERAELASSVQRVVVATPDVEVREAVEAFGAEAVMTSPQHPNGTSRLAEAAGALGLGEADIVVNVQGDEPEIDPASIDAAVDALRRGEAPVATLATPLRDARQHADANVVKVAMDGAGRALLFSRAPIPHAREAAFASGAGPWRHVGLYVYRAGFLRRYVELPETPLEATERLEQLRVLEHGYQIAVAVVEAAGEGIDTPGQYREFVERWRAQETLRRGTG